MRTLLLAVSVVLVSCGSAPSVGDSCEVDTCDVDGRSVLSCLDGRLQRFDCAGGCRENDGAVTCDPRGSSVGMTCPPSLGFRATCGDDGVLICFSGIWQSLHACEPNATALYSLCDTDQFGIGARCVQLNADGTAQR